MAIRSARGRFRLTLRLGTLVALLLSGLAVAPSAAFAQDPPADTVVGVGDALRRFFDRFVARG